MRLLEKQHSVLFCIAVSEHRVYVLLPFLPSALISSSFKNEWDFESVRTLAESEYMLPLRLVLHVFDADVGLFPTLHGL